uniref:Uncharacterized protein n=1 Tax=Biomphalaria glabrata TaxID=6526 RepID=A0A2C9LUD9_BIOGL
MASSVSTPVVVPQATKRTHAKMSGSEVTDQQSPVKASSEADSVAAAIPDLNGSESKSSLDSAPENTAVTKISNSVTPVKEDCKVSSSDSSPKMDVTSPTKQSAVETDTPASKVSVEGASTENSSVVDCSSAQENKKDCDDKLSTCDQTTSINSDTSKAAPEAMDAQASNVNHDTVTALTETSQITTGNSASKAESKPNSGSHLEEGEEPEKKAKLSPPSVKSTGKSPEQILEHMDKTFEQRRKIITKQMPTIPELKNLYPNLFMGKQLLIEFQRITKIDIDQKIQEFCVRYATAVIEMARTKKGAAPVLARWEQAKQENDNLRQYWDMVTALCLLPLHFGENFVEMVLEIGEDEEVVPQGKIVPTLVARGNIFRTDEFFLIAENTIVQEFEEFTIAFASLYSSYWVFNMMYPETIENTYNYIQRCIVRQREPGSIPAVCKNFTKSLQKWNKVKEGK